MWSPQLGARERHVAEAAALLPDPRARHYWDGRSVVGRAFQPVLPTQEPAWDVWMLFDRAARWDDPPTPRWWEHQHKLPGMPEDRTLDPGRFSSKAGSLLADLTDR